MFESFASNDFSIYFSLYHCFSSCLHITQSSFYQTRHNDGSISSFIEVEAIIWNRCGDDFLFSVHVAYCTFVTTITKYSILYFWQQKYAKLPRANKLALHLGNLHSVFTTLKQWLDMPFKAYLRSRTLVSAYLLPLFLSCSSVHTVYTLLKIFLWNEWLRASSPQGHFRILVTSWVPCYLCAQMRKNTIQRSSSLISTHWRLSEMVKSSMKIFATGLSPTSRFSVVIQKSLFSDNRISLDSQSLNGYSIVLHRIRSC